MEIDPEDQDIVRLLGRLKDVHGEYPEKMFLARRRSYLKQMKEIGLGLSGGMGIWNLIKIKKLPRLAPVIGTLLETALILVIVTEASAMAYLYRDKLSDLFGNLTTTSRNEEVTPPASPAITSTEVTVTPTGTPVPGIVNNTPAVNQLNTTPIPDEDNGNHGHHYGQTPKPERTKENNGNPDKPPKDDDNKPPKEKDDQPPKEEPKPTKDK